jgi:hypothetical protein
MIPRRRHQTAGKPSEEDVSAATRNAPSDSEAFTERLSDEYKILQDKIDKIGAFKFTIKGWSITAVIAATAATNGKGLATALAASLGLVVMLWFFFLFEREQDRLRILFGDRASRLEDAFRRIDRGKGEEMRGSFPVPYIAHDLALAELRRRSSGPGSSGSVRGKPTPRSLSGKWQELKKADIKFYLSLIGLSLMPLLPSFSTAKGYAEALMQRVGHALPRCW